MAAKKHGKRSRNGMKKNELREAAGRGGGNLMEKTEQRTSAWLPSIVKVFERERERERRHS